MSSSTAIVLTTSRTTARHRHLSPWEIAYRFMIRICKKHGRAFSLLLARAARRSFARQALLVAESVDCGPSEGAIHR
ncbi:hypothetical protein ACFQ61_12405 [Streptomyces sp. NPDC056500]|uniref:hypothetical protein n=1 Tax=Streptomyces sp. NPDC056500 TaxID=3345840 RepID=UPI0036B27DA2